MTRLEIAEKLQTDPDAVIAFAFQRLREREEEREAFRLQRVPRLPELTKQEQLCWHSWDLAWERCEHCGVSRERIEDR